MHGLSQGVFELWTPQNVAQLMTNIKQVSCLVIHSWLVACFVPLHEFKDHLVNYDGDDKKSALVTAD